MFPANLTIRDARHSDAAAVARLAVLDSAPVPAGELVLGVIDGDVVAAVPVAGGAGIADPFRPTAEVVRLLELRAAQMRAARRERRRPLLGRHASARHAGAPAR